MRVRVCACFGLGMTYQRTCLIVFVLVVFVILVVLVVLVVLVAVATAKIWQLVVVVVALPFALAATKVTKSHLAVAQSTASDF